MPEPVDFGYAVDLPPERAIEYFRSKGYILTGPWWELWQEQHALAFTVARVAKLDVLEDIRTALDTALSEGQTFRQFAGGGLVDTLRRKGWWGRTKEGVQIGSYRRLKTIFRTNMATARAASRYQAMSDNVIDRPYWMYDAMDDSRTRPTHAALDNRVFRHDDPFWQTFFPPNGWGCRCRVRAFTLGEVSERGLKVFRSEGRLREIDQLVDERTGLRRPSLEYAIEDPPRGAPRRFSTDPGWGYPPVSGAAAVDLLAERIARNPDLFARTIG